MLSIKQLFGFPYELAEGNLSDEMTIFQSSDIQSEFFRNAWVYGIRQKSIPVTYIVYENGIPQMLFPAMRGKNSISLAGSVNGICSLCPIYFRETKDYKECLTYLLRSVSADQINTQRIFEDSTTAKILNSGIEGFYIEKRDTENVRIFFREGYDQWNKALRKSVRQNLRTAYNRANTDDINIKFELYKGGEISAQLAKRFVEIYNNRHEERYGVKTTTIKRFYMQHFDFSTRALRDKPVARHGILYLNDQIAAFFSGYYDEKTQSVAVPRLSIDPKYQRYSPGYLLISEAIKYYQDGNQVTCLDLSTGAEKYKLDLGGEVYMKCDYRITKQV